MTDRVRSLRILDEVIDYAPDFDTKVKVKTIAEALHHMFEFLDDVPEAEPVVREAQKILLREANF